VVVCIPFNPCFLVGTQLWQEARNWMKWRIRRLTARYTPNSGGLQTGSWIMAFDHDPATVNGLLTSNLAKERRFTSMEDCVMFSVSDVAELHFSTHQTVPVWFPVIPGTNDVELTIENLFILAAGSSFTPIGTETSFVTGSVTFHYEIEFAEHVTNSLTVTLPTEVTGNVSDTNTNIWSAVTVNSPVSFKAAILASLGITMTKLYQIVVLIITKSVSSGGLDLFVSDYHQTAFKFLSQGNVYFLRLQDDGGPGFVYLSLQDAIAIGQNTTLEWQVAPVGASTTTFSFWASVIDLRL
jgi:hypothetical protein